MSTWRLTSFPQYCACYMLIIITLTAFAKCALCSLLTNNDAQNPRWLCATSLAPIGSRAFHISAPHIWNSLPTNFREAQSLLTFRRHLKTHYFQSAFSTPYRAACQRTLILFKISALHKSFTYLITIHSQDLLQQPSVWHDKGNFLTSFSVPRTTWSGSSGRLTCKVALTAFKGVDQTNHSEYLVQTYS